MMSSDPAKVPEVSCRHHPAFGNESQRAIDHGLTHTTQEQSSALEWTRHPCRACSTARPRSASDWLRDPHIDIDDLEALHQFERCAGIDDDDVEIRQASEAVRCDGRELLSGGRHDDALG